MNKSHFESDKPINNINNIDNMKHDVLCIKNFKNNKDLILEQSSLINMTFGTVVKLVNDKQLYTTKSVETIREYHRKPKVEVYTTSKNANMLPPLKSHTHSFHSQHGFDVAHCIVNWIVGVLRFTQMFEILKHVLLHAFIQRAQVS